MAFYNGVYETSTTTGTGTYTLAGAFVASGATVSAYQTFAAVGDGNQCYYRAQDNENGGWEYGVGTYTASGTTLARTTILGSSNANAAVSWIAGTRQIFLIEPAELLNVFTIGLDGRVTINVSAGATSPPTITSVNLQHILPDTVTGASLVGYLSGIATGAGNTHNQSALKGADLTAEHAGSGTISLICGSDFDAEHLGSALATTVIGGRGLARNNSTGTVTNLSGFVSIWGNEGAGAVASAAAFRTQEDGGGGPITNNYGYTVSSLTQGTNNYGYHSGISAAANTYAFYGAGTAASFFGGQVGVGGVPGASAAFQVDSTTQGNLAPRMTSTQKSAIATPATGLEVYDTTLNAKCIYNGTAWTTESSAAITVDADNSTITIDWSAGAWHSTTLTASRTIAFSNDFNGAAITIIFKSGGTGAFTPVWPATVKWFGGVAPVLTNVSGHWDLVSIKRESSGNYIGTFSPNYF